MFKISGKLKLFSLIILVLGAIGIIYGFISTPSNIDDVKEIAAQHQAKQNAINHSENTLMVDRIKGEGFSEKAMDKANQEDTQPSESFVQKTFHQLKARPWSATFVAAFFFLMIALGALVFHAIQYATESGWSPVLYRVFEGVTGYLLIGSIIVALIVLFAGTHFFPWQNADLVAGDEELQVKSLFLNMPFFVVRLLIYLLVWNGYRFLQQRNAREQVNASDYAPHKRNYNLSIWFLILFGITESPMAWDWFMSMTPHWFSALFAWYIFASMFVSALAVITLIAVNLKKRGYLEFVNDSHLHDLGKYMFAFSIFWTYFWFAQFMLIWYANIPEEVTHFVMRIQHYNVLFFGMLLTNFIFPILILMNSDFKRIPWIVSFVSIFILIGHYVAIYLIVIPSTMGTYGSFGIPEIGALLFFLGLFILIVGNTLGKKPLKLESNPYLKESENYHY